MHRSAFVLALLVPLALAACESDPDAATPRPSDVSAVELAPELTRSFNEGIGSLENFRVFALGTSLYYLVVGDSTNPALTLVRDPEAGMPNNMAAGNLFGLFPPRVPLLAGNLPNMSQGGIVERDGVQTLVFESAQPQHAGMGAAQGTKNHLVRIYLDAETRDIRELFHRFEVDTIATPLAQRILYSDYREVAPGVRLPFEVKQIQEGLKPSEEETMVRGASFALREQQIRQLPAAERQVAMNELEREKRFFREGINEITLTIDSIRVNVPPPDTLAAPGIL